MGCQPISFQHYLSRDERDIWRFCSTLPKHCSPNSRIFNGFSICEFLFLLGERLAFLLSLPPPLDTFFTANVGFVSAKQTEFNKNKLRKKEKGMTGIRRGLRFSELYLPSLDEVIISLGEGSDVSRDYKSPCYRYYLMKLVVSPCNQLFIYRHCICDILFITHNIVSYFFVVILWNFFLKSR